ncbi:MAG: putative 4-hydroxybenzoate polyprenyltransferase [Elusimicrobia bacterium]|nr:putative 4-hydroxybenzoate polyprenyltransferase [Candidatus Obscuribacterium magneticum]
MVFQTYLEFLKIEHTLFSIPLLFAGAFLANGRWPSFRESFLILFAGVCARCVALTLNRIIDREIDRKNPRTKDRHIPSGRMKLFEAWLLMVLSLLVYLFVAWLLSDFCLKWSWVPIIGFSFYPYLKRFTRWSHLGLGLVWGLVPVAGFLAVKPSFHEIEATVMLGVFCIFWLTGFDIIYATLDEEFDRKFHLYSLPAALGSKRALKYSAFFHLLAFLCLVWIYINWFSGPITLMLLLINGILLYLEQEFSFKVDFAFFRVNAIIGFVVLLFVFSGIRGY